MERQIDNMRVIGILLLSIDECTYDFMCVRMCVCVGLLFRSMFLFAQFSQMALIVLCTRMHTHRGKDGE